jgi:hypothetical protein
LTPLSRASTRRDAQRQDLAAIFRPAPQRADSRRAAATR